MKKHDKTQIDELFNLLETVAACEIEVHNIDFSAKDSLTYDYPIHLN